jgi:site-specific recombinase XerD
MGTKLQIVVPETPYTPIIRMVLDGLDSLHSQRAYERALNDFLAWYHEAGHRELKRSIVASYIAYLRDSLGMAPAYINLRLVAIRRLVREAAENNLLDQQTAMAIERLKGVRDEGHRTGVWLTRGQATDLINTPDTATVKGLRDRAVLATLIGAGLRREELTNLTFAHIQQRDGRWAIINIVGKRNKVRSVPIAPWNKVYLDAWATAAHLTEGAIFRAMDRGDHVTPKPLSPQSIMDIVKQYIDESGLSGIADAAPHDLRRTFAQLARKGGASLEQISINLGHESIETTQRYLGIEQDFIDAPCDHLGLQLSA